MKQIDESKILYTNAKNLGIDLLDLYILSSKEIAKRLLDKFSSDRVYTFVCGLGGNGCDGLLAAHELANKGVNVRVYIIGRVSNAESPLFEEAYELLTKDSKENLVVLQDCYDKDIEQTDVVVEALAGTGLKGVTLYKRFHDVIKRISHFNCKLVAIDKPTPSYTPDITFSLIYPKTESAEVIKVDLPEELELYVGPGEVEALETPKTTSHKSKNGKLLIISSTEDFENILLTLNIAKEYSVHCYVYNFNQDNQELKDQTKKQKNVEVIDDESLESCIDQTDVILYLKIEEESLLVKGLLNELVCYQDKKQIIQGEALEIMSSEDIFMLKDKMIIGDNEHLNPFIKAYGGTLRNLSHKFSTNIVNVGMRNTIYSPEGNFKIGLRKEFSEESQNILIALIAVLSTKNPMYLASRAAHVIALSR